MIIPEDLNVLISLNNIDSLDIPFIKKTYSIINSRISTDYNNVRENNKIFL